MKKITSFFLCIVILLASFSMSVFAKSENLNFVVLGDSIAWGTGIYNSDKACYGRIVANTNNYNYKNYAFDGCRSWDLLALLEQKDVADDIKNADIINISIGGNDFLQQNLFVLVPEVYTKKYNHLTNIEKDLVVYFAEIIETIKSYNPGATLIVNLLYNSKLPIMKDIYGEAVTRVNKIIRSYLEEHPGAYELLHIDEVMEKSVANTAIDTIHPSAVGNEVIAKELLLKLNELGLGENTEPKIEKIGIDEVPFFSYILRYLLSAF